MLNKLIAITFLFLFMGAVTADEIFVDVDLGKDENQGDRVAPLKTFPAALAKSLPGDTIFILPVSHPIPTALVIKNKKGLPDKPVIIDGMMNTLVGTRAVSGKDWQEVSPGTGLYHRQQSSPPTGTRYFMRFNGKMERMGRHTKWKGAALKKIEELKDYEWTIAGKNDFYFKIPAGMKSSEVQAEEPFFESGVKMSGECAYLVVRNLIVRQFWNDGYNIHDNCRDILFENVAALENSDDGVSAHETCQVKIKNMVSIGNGTGFCHIQQSECEHENVYIAGSDSRDIYLLNSRNGLKNVIVNGNAHGAMEFRDGRVTLDDCLFLNRRPGVRLGFFKCETRAAGTEIAQYVIEGTLPDGVGVAESPEALQRKIEKSRASILAVFGDKIGLK